MYLHLNKYLIWYSNIIYDARIRTLPTDRYVETHHVIPKSFYKIKSKTGWLNGNPNLLDNLVILTAREHFVCHLLLYKFTTEIAKQKMVYALRRMINLSKNKQRYKNSRVYENIMIEQSSITSQRWADPLIRDSIIDKMKNAYTDDLRQLRSRQMIDRWNDSTIQQKEKIYDNLRLGTIGASAKIKNMTPIEYQAYCLEQKRRSKLSSNKTREWRNSLKGKDLEDYLKRQKDKSIIGADKIKQKFKTMTKEEKESIYQKRRLSRAKNLEKLTPEEKELERINRSAAGKRAAITRAIKKSSTQA